MHPFIPEEIVIAILTHLPPDSLARFKCVSKQWYRLISETLNNMRRKVLTMSWDKDCCRFQSIDQETLKVEDVDIPWKDDADVKFYGSCNGLLLVESYDDLFLWNPFIRYHQKILSYKDLSWHNGFGGLCLDLIKKEYKVVLCLRQKFIRIGEFVVVGSPRDKSWKHVDFPYGGVHSGPLLNNRLHWFVDRKDLCHLKQSLIIYFDAKVDRFIEFPLPLNEDKTCYILNLGVLDGCLCLSCTEGSVYDQTVIVMAMKEYGVQESWTVLFKLEGESYVFARTALPLFYLDGNKTEVLISIKRSYGYGTIIAYDTNSNSESKAVTIIDRLRHQIVYEETSVKPIGYDWEELDSRGEAFYVEIFDSNCQKTMKKDKNGYWYDPEESDEYDQESAVQ